MKLNYFTLSLLVIIIFISCVIIIYHQGRKSIVNDINLYNDHLIKFVTKETVHNTIIENFIDDIKPENILKFNKIDVLKKNQDGNSYNRKIVHIKGENLSKIKDVFFGDINGLILNKNLTNLNDNEIESITNLKNGNQEDILDYTISNEMFILPPDFMKYRDVVSEKELEEEGWKIE